MLSFDESDYLQMMVSDKLPADGSELAMSLKKNPKLLHSDVKKSDSTYTWSIITRALGNGNLHAADFILKQNGQIKPSADPCYCGKIGGGISNLLRSASINFYLALVTLQCYAQRDKLTELINSESFIVRKTHYDCLYWEDARGEHHPAVIEADEDTPQSQINDYQRETAKFFMKMAYTAFQAEIQLSTTTSLIRKATINETLGGLYLHTAFMEDYSRYAFYYFLDKALGHYRAASLESQIVYLDDCVAHREELFETQREKLNALLYVEETDSYRLRAPEEWQELYNSTYQANSTIEDSAVMNALHPETHEEVQSVPKSTLRHRSLLGSSSIILNPAAFTYSETSKDTTQRETLLPSTSLFSRFSKLGKNS